MAQADLSKSDEMSAEKVIILTIKPYQQSFVFIDQSECSFRCKASFVDFSIEQSFPASFGGFAVALVFIYVWNMIYD